MASAVPVLGGKALENAVRAYEAGQTHNAQVASPDPPWLWRSFGRPTAENAETAALENCQINYGRPCALVAVDNTLQPIPADRSWPRRDMPRARYSGSFEPAQIPGAAPALRDRSDIVNYRTAPASKAAAFPRSAVAFLRLSGRPANARQRRRASMLHCRPPAQDREWFVFPLCRRRSGGPAVAPLCSNDNTAGSARFVLAPGCTFGRVGIGGAQSKREDQRGTSARL